MVRWTWSLAIAGTLLLVACNADAPSIPTDTSMAPGPQLGNTVARDGLGLGALALYRVTVDPGSLKATATLRAARNAQQNDDLYLLPVDRFFGADHFQIRAVRSTATTLDIDYTIRHPFAAPPFPASPATAANRADLGIAGMALFLVDVPAASGNTYFTDAVANTGLVANADAYYRPAGLLATDTIANTFPYKRFIDETEGGNREGLSNGGAVTGNFGTDGWTRGELGPNNNGWTGYGVLHQGQSATNTVSLDLAALAGHGELNFDVALIAKYNDPRGGATPAEKRANRLPPATPDHTRFAYRMPHGALDAEAIRFEGESGGFRADQATSSTLRFHVVDWDARATESTFADLAQDPDVTNVAQGASGFPGLALSIPGVLGDATAVNEWDPASSVQNDDAAYGGDPASDSGLPGDALFYQRVVLKPMGSGQPIGTLTGLVRATDPESGLGYLTPLDADLTPLTENLPRPETFQVFTVEQAQATTASGGWVAPQIGNASNVFGTHVNVAPDGSSYATGTYYGSLDFDPGPGVANRISMSDGGNYLVKYDSNGNFVWVATVGAEDDYPGGTAIAPGGEVYLVGTFSPPQDFDPGPGTEFRTQGNAYCLKLSAAGAFQWVQTWDAPLQIYNSRVVVDAGGNPRISGIFRGTVDFDPGAGTANHTSGTDAYDPFLVALGAAGQYQWSRNWGGGTGSQQLLPWGLDISPVGQYAVANVLTGTGDFDPGPGVANLTAVGQGDAYVLKLDSAGNYLWARSWGGPFSDGANGVEFDAAGNVRVAGEFHDTVDFDPGAGVVNRTAVGSTDGFALALDAAGTFQWVGTFGGLGFDGPRDIAVDSTGAVRLAGSFMGTADFDPGPGVINRTASSDGLQCFVLGLTPAGTFEWVTTWGNTQNGMAVETGPNDAVWHHGSFFGLVDFDPGPGIDNRDAGMTTGGYVVKLTSSGGW